MSGPRTFRLIGRGSFARGASDPGSPRASSIVVARNAEEFARLWDAHIGSPRPAVDFSRELAIILLLGSRATGGYAVAVESVSVEGTKAIVRATVTKPTRGGIVTEAFTAPYVAVAVSGQGVERAEWLDVDGRIVARSE